MGATSVDHLDGARELGAPGSGLRSWESPGWCSIPGLVHMFLGRNGGASTGPWESLNLSRNVGDDQAAVEENWRRVARAASGIAITRMGQVHGCSVVRVDTPVGSIDGVDGLFTAVGGVGLAVMTADCVPILMMEPNRRIAVALHAGWRGTLEGIAQVGVTRARTELGVSPSAFRAALGPAISGCCYEVEADIARRLEARWGSLGSAWRQHGAKGLLDLREVNRKILIAAGLLPEAIEVVGPCTACQMRNFFSHRGSGGKTGRQISLIGWT